MAEGVETHVVAARGHARPCRPAPPPPPRPSRLAALDWGRVSFGVPRRKIILLGLSVVGVAGIYVLVKNGKLTFPDLSDMPDLPALPDLPTLRLPALPNLRHLVFRKLQPPAKAIEKPEALHLGQCKFGYQDM